MAGRLLIALVTLGALTWPHGLPPYWVNLSASMPRGVYRLDEARGLRAGDVVLFDLPKTLTALSMERPWLSPTAPLLKRVGAVTGSVMCRRGSKVTIDGRAVGAIQRRDRAGERLPGVRGCRSVGPNRFVALGLRKRASFDSRYFGSVSTGLIRGHARLLYRF